VTVGEAPDRAVFNHVGLCVADAARSRRFYEELLGFRFWWELRPPDDLAGRVCSLDPPVGLHATYLVRDGMVLELLAFAGGAVDPGRRRVMNEPGLTHLSLAVPDVDAVLARVPELGGAVLGSTRVAGAVMITDPDGQLVELTTLAWRRALPPPPG
jgi:lactoylglutathione lyase